MTDKTIRELQSSLPWTAHYHRDFRANPLTHKDFAHALLHIQKAGGKLAGIIDEAEHGGFDWDQTAKRDEVGKYVADMVICALRMANTCPDGVMDLQRLVEDRLTAKNNQLAEAAPALAAAEGNDIDIALVIAALSSPQKAAIMQAKSVDERGPLFIPTYRDGGKLARGLCNLGLTRIDNDLQLTPIGRQVHLQLNPQVRPAPLNDRGV